MSAERKLTKIQQAYARCDKGRAALCEMGRCMETTEDKAYGILWERFVVGDKMTSVVLYATPDWWDVFVPLTDDKTIDGTIAAIKAMK